MAKKKAAKKKPTKIKAADTEPVKAEATAEKKRANPDDAGVCRLLLESFINGDTPDEIVVELKKLGIETNEKKTTKAMAKLGKLFDWTNKKLKA